MLKPLNLSDSAMYLLRVDVNTYRPFNALQISTSSFSLSFSNWYKRLSHLNFLLLKIHLNWLNIKYENNSYDYICDGCLWVKVTKSYNCDSQKHSNRLYQFIYIDLVGPINSINFVGEKYFIIFTDNTTRMTETYIKTKKSNWLKYLKIYHSLCRTKSKKPHLIERLRSDYRSELQSYKVDEWIQKKGITFELSAPYFQEQNRVSEKTRRTIIDITRAIILERNIDNDL